MSVQSEYPNGKFAYTILQRGQQPQYKECDSLDACVKESFEDFLYSVSKDAILFSCVCSKNDIISDIKEQVYGISPGQSSFDLFPHKEWKDTQCTANYYTFYCNNERQKYQYEEDYLICHFTVPDLPDASINTPEFKTQKIFQIAFVQGIGPFLIHKGFPPSDATFDQIRNCFFSVRDSFDERNDPHQVSNYIQSNSRLQSLKLRLIIHFPENCYNLLCDILRSNPSLVFDRVVRIQSFKNMGEIIDEFASSQQHGMPITTEQYINLMELFANITHSVKDVHPINIIDYETRDNLVTAIHEFIISLREKIEVKEENLSLIHQLERANQLISVIKNQESKTIIK